MASRFTLFVGDRMFSSWSARASIIVAESDVPCDERIFELDWPVRYEGADAMPVPPSEMGEEPASGCICEGSQLLRAEPTGALARSFLSEIPRVPFLLDTHRALVVGDSVAIAEYLAEEFPSAMALLGGNPARRAMVRTLVAHVHADYLPMMSGMSYSKSFHVDSNDEPSAAALDQAGVMLRVMARLLADGEGPFLFGSFSLADIILTPIIKT